MSKGMHTKVLIGGLHCTDNPPMHRKKSSLCKTKNGHEICSGQRFVKRRSYEEQGHKEPCECMCHAMELDPDL